MDRDGGSMNRVRTLLLPLFVIDSPIRFSIHPLILSHPPYSFSGHSMSSYAVITKIDVFQYVSGV